ncbi:hypothetical protein HMPREF0591_0220, partial [Mycobacterium parascrofulaceum ATCC BAA-614]
MDLGGQPAAGTPDRMIVGLIGRFLVIRIRQCPLCTTCPNGRPPSVD